MAAMLRIKKGNRLCLEGIRKTDSGEKGGIEKEGERTLKVNPKEGKILYPGEKLQGRHHAVILAGLGSMGGEKKYSGERCMLRAVSQKS